MAVMARLGRCGEVCMVGQSGRGLVSYGRLGMVRQGSQVKVWTGGVRIGALRRGVARHGSAVEVGHVLAR